MLLLSKNMKIKKCAGAPLSWNLAFLRENARFEKKITDGGCYLVIGTYNYYLNALVKLFIYLLHN